MNTFIPTIEIIFQCVKYELQIPFMLLSNNIILLLLQIIKSLDFINKILNSINKSLHMNYMYIFIIICILIIFSISLINVI